MNTHVIIKSINLPLALGIFNDILRISIEMAAFVVLFSIEEAAISIEIRSKYYVPRSIYEVVRAVVLVLYQNQYY